MTNDVMAGKTHRYTIVVPGLPPYDADVFALNQVADLQFAWEEDDGKTKLAIVRFPTNVVVVDNECPETVESLKTGLDEFREKMHDDHIAAAEQATKGVKLPCYQ